MKIAVHPDHFSSRAQAYDEIEIAALHPVDMTVPPVSNDSHWHDFSTQLYILEGELCITDVAQDRTLVAGPGARVDVPARVLHREESDQGYTLIAGMSVNPETLEGDVDLDPQLLEESPTNG